MFESVNARMDGRTDAHTHGRWLESHLISSSRAFSSGELKYYKQLNEDPSENLAKDIKNTVENIAQKVKKGELNNLVNPTIFCASQDT